jgi:hypothetical protein
MGHALIRDHFLESGKKKILPLQQKQALNGQQSKELIYS